MDNTIQADETEATQGAEYTEIELLDAVGQALRDAKTPQGAMSTEQISEELGLSPPAVRRRIRALKKAGKVETVSVTIEDISERITSIPAYRFIK